MLFVVHMKLTKWQILLYTFLAAGDHACSYATRNSWSDLLRATILGAIFLA